MVWICTKISIHAPTRGATPGARTLDTLIKNFNPRSHEGSDAMKCNNKRKCAISIHAPTRGATVARVYSGVQPYYFNPRSHEGSDYRFLKGSRSGYYFNPRSHEGSDDRVQCILCAITQFQSTLPRGERQCRLKYEIEQAEISIHAPTRGAT